MQGRKEITSEDFERAIQELPEEAREPMKDRYSAHALLTLQAIITHEVQYRDAIIALNKYARDIYGVNNYVEESRL